MLKEKLNEILRMSNNSLIKGVARSLLSKIKCEGEEDTREYIKEVLMYGCSSGIVTELIYYTDTKKFFTKYMDEILDILNESIHEGVNASELDTNSMAWYGYEWAISEINFMLNY